MHMYGKLKLLEALNRHAKVFSGSETNVVPNSFMRRYPNGTATAIPTELAQNDADTYHRAIYLAVDVIKSADPQWRDPRSRSETNRQFSNVVRTLARDTSLV